MLTWMVGAHAIALRIACFGAGGRLSNVVIAFGTALTGSMPPGKKHDDIYSESGRGATLRLKHETHDIFAERNPSGFDPIAGILKIGMGVAHEFASRFKGESKSWKQCKHHIIDVGFNSGSSALAFYSGMYSFDYCNALAGNGGKTHTNWVRGLGNIASRAHSRTKTVAPASLAPLAKPGQFCYHAFEGNPMFSPTMQMIDAFLEGVGGRSVMYPETLFADKDGFSPLYVDKVAESAWGSSMFAEKTWNCDTAEACKATKTKSERFKVLNVSSISASRFTRQLRASLGPEGKIALKINAEGAEYFILRDLIQKDALCEVDYLFVSWHVKQLASQIKTGKLRPPAEYVRDIVEGFEQRAGCRVQWLIDAVCDGGMPYSREQVDHMVGG